MVKAREFEPFATRSDSSPIISIGLPAFNCEEMLAIAIRSEASRPNALRFSWSRIVDQLAHI
jgi:hypothetical protein